MNNFNRDWKQHDTAEPMNKCEMFIHGASFVIFLVALIYWVLA